jgi:hypothetical protein
MNIRSLVAVAALSTMLGACVSGIAEDPAQAQRCANPLRGSRFSLCGHLSASELDATAVNGRRVLGAVDSTHPAVRSQYVVKGGTFHAHR